MFVRGGNVNPGDYLNYAGDNGNYWSSVSYYSSYAYRLGFYSGGISPSSADYRYFGFSIRCIALGG